MLVVPGAMSLAQSIGAVPSSASYRIWGVVWISPTCAGGQKEGELCRMPRAGADVQLKDLNGRVVVSTQSGSKGEFSLYAPAGTYRLGAVGLGKVMRCPEQSVTLPMPKSAPVDLECDSGIR